MSHLQPVPADQATRSHDCKTPGCEEPSRSAVGRYSYCDRCRGKREAERAANPRPDPAPLKSGTPASFEGRAKELAQFGKRLDRALSRLKPVHDEAAAAKKAWNEALERLAQ